MIESQKLRPQLLPKRLETPSAVNGKQVGGNSSVTAVSASSLSQTLSLVMGLYSATKAFGWFFSTCKNTYFSPSPGGAAAEFSSGQEGRWWFFLQYVVH